MLSAADPGQASQSLPKTDLHLPFASEVPAEAELPVPAPKEEMTIDIGSLYTAFVSKPVQGALDPNRPLPTIHEMKQTRDGLEPRNLSSNTFAQNEGAAKEATHVAIETIDSCRERSGNLDQKTLALLRKMTFGQGASLEYRTYPDDYVVYENAKIGLHPDSATRRANGEFLRPGNVICDASFGSGRAFAVQLYALFVGHCVELVLEARPGLSRHEIVVGLLCPDSWDFMTKEAVMSAILRRRFPAENGNGVEHLRRKQFVWLSESYGALLSAVLDVQNIPSGTAVDFDVGGHTTDGAAMTVEDVPGRGPTLRDFLAVRSFRSGGNDINIVILEFLFLHFFGPLGVTWDDMDAHPQSVHLLMEEIERRKKDHKPRPAGPADSRAVKTWLQKTHALNLRPVFDEIGVQNWMVRLQRHNEERNARPQDPMKFIDPKRPGYSQDMSVFRDLLKRKPYVPEDAAGGFKLQGARLEISPKLFEKVIGLHAESLHMTAGDFIKALNGAPKYPIASGKAINLTKDNNGQGSGQIVCRKVEAFLFTGDGATGLTHRGILEEKLKTVNLAPGQAPRVVSFPKRTQMHTLFGGALLLQHRDLMLPPVQCGFSLGARLNVFLRDKRGTDGEPVVYKKSLREAGITDEENGRWNIWNEDGKLDIVIPAIQAGQTVRINDSFQFGEAGETFLLPPNTDIQLDIYQSRKPMPKPSKSSRDPPPLLVAHNPRKRNDPPLPANLPIVSVDENLVAGYVHSYKGPERRCRTNLRFSDQGAMIVELQVLRKVDGGFEVDNTHVLKAVVPTAQEAPNSPKVKKERGARATKQQKTALDSEDEDEDAMDLS